MIVTYPFAFYTLGCEDTSPPKTPKIQAFFFFQSNIAKFKLEKNPGIDNTSFSSIMMETTGMSTFAFSSSPVAIKVKSVGTLEG